MSYYFVPGSMPTTPRGEARKHNTHTFENPKRVVEVCTCGFRIRGPDHEKGHHHKKDSNFVRKGAMRS